VTTTLPPPPNLIKVATNPVGAGVDLATGLIGVDVPDPTAGLAGRLSSFASDRILDIGATLVLMALGVAITTAGVLRVFAAGSNTETGKAAVQIGTAVAGAKGAKF